MKRNTFFALALITIILVGCRIGGPEMFGPVITLNGDKTVVVIQYSSSDYSDPGATAIDDDGNSVLVTVSGSVKMNQSGYDTLYYSSTNEWGDMTVFRVVVVDGAQYISDYYLVSDYTDTIPNGNSTDSITVDNQSFNSVFFKQFAGYNNCNLHATTSDSTLTIPAQTINCGSPLADRTFIGTGVYSKDFTSFTIYYTETTNSVTKYGHCIYTKN